MLRSPMTVVLLGLVFICGSQAATAQVLLDYEPTTREVILNTDFTQVVPKNGPPFNVAGGVFVFRNVTIPAGVTVRGTGTKPMIWLVTGDFTVHGRLAVDGGDGASVHTLNAANFPAPGGLGVCTGGNGGQGSPNTKGTSLMGGIGYGPYMIKDLGGFGGVISCLFSGTRGSGGGGGAFTTRGDPHYPYQGAQQLGFGGNGGQTTFYSPPGQPLFGDSRRDNDFFGVALNVHTRQFIRGELPVLAGGGGGGGGGDRSSLCTNNPAWFSDNKGGGGGGGGGALVIYAQGKIVVGPAGKISADGGNGGGGEWAASNIQGGGGGGGAGGMIVLVTNRHVELHVHGETYGRQDYDFSISAEGGIGYEGTFGSTGFTTKYPPRPHPKTNGGMGGMGLIQFFLPLDFKNLDKTNTILDDNVHFYRGATRLTGAEKIRYLAWRGFPNQLNIHVDDNGRPTNIGANEGDIRPSPILLPLF